MKRLIHSGMALVTAMSLYTTANLIAQPIEAFTYRAPLDPFRIHQLPDFMIHSRERSDFVIQRGVFPVGVGGWHTHPGPSLAYVIQGHIKLQIFTDKDGCYETPVYGPGDVYIKPANQLHRAIVLGAEQEVEMIVRFNFPLGGPIGIPAADPGCGDPDVLVSAAPLHQQSHVADTLENFIAQHVAPFTFRATLDPFQIHQLPDFLLHSRVPSDLVFQRSLFKTGAGSWHIHPGPSFVYVIDGQIKLQKFTEKEGCFETEVYGPGQAYFEVGNQVHRAVVVSDDSAVLLVVRFLPVGAPITIFVPDPGCFSPFLPWNGQWWKGRSPSSSPIPAASDRVRHDGFREREGRQSFPNRP